MHHLVRFLKFLSEGRVWMNLQSQYDADIAREAIGDDLESIEPFALQA
jgi:plasmid maintenance system antidote protein VapI